MLSSFSGLLLLVVASGAGYSLNEIPVTRWIDDGSDRRPGTYEDWLTTHPLDQPWRVKPIVLAQSRYGPKLDIIVNAVLFDSIRSALDTLKDDLGADGYDVSIFAVSGGSAESLRFFLRQRYDSGLMGAILLGDLPVPWFQMIDEWNGNGRRDPDEGYEEFPCDLYYLDLDGIWFDSLRRVPGRDSLVFGNDGIYDHHVGDVAPDIWLGRITARPCGNEPVLVRNYLGKVHAYRNGNLCLNDRGLSFVDDDWEQWATEFDYSLSLLYPDRVLLSHPETTKAARYRQCLAENYQWVSLFAHSSPLLHAMKYNRGNSWSWFYEQEVPTHNPIANFYNLFACSNARYTDTGYMAGRYIYSTTTGLNSIGSTKTGSMLQFTNFYAPLGAGYRLGEAFKAWFEAMASGGFDSVERSWFYGMSLHGDPTLSPRVPLHDVAVAAILAPAGAVDSGAEVVPVCRVVNNGLRDEHFPVRFRIGTDYDEICWKTLLRGESDTVVFPVWRATSVGVVATRCSAGLNSDERPGNDAISWWVTVRRAAGLASPEEESGQLSLNAEPNPVKGQLRVSGSFPGASFARLRLFDCRGQEVWTRSIRKQQSGQHSFALSLSTNKLSADVYILRLETDDGVGSRHLVIVR